MNPWIIIGIIAFATFLVLGFAGALFASILGIASASTVGILTGCLVGSVIVGGFVWGEVLR